MPPLEPPVEEVATEEDASAEVEADEPEEVEAEADEAPDAVEDEADTEVETEVETETDRLGGARPVPISSPEPAVRPLRLRRLTARLTLFGDKHVDERPSSAS